MPLSDQPPYWSQVTTESMKSGSTSPTQSHMERSKSVYLPFGAVIASKAALESSDFCLISMPIFRNAAWMIWNVRGMLCTSVGVITLYDILEPFATRIPSEPFLYPSPSRMLFAFARLNGVGLTAGLYQAPDDGEMIESPGCAAPRKTTRTICARSI